MTNNWFSWLRFGLFGGKALWCSVEIRVTSDERDAAMKNVPGTMKGAAGRRTTQRGARAA